MQGSKQHRVARDQRQGVGIQHHGPRRPPPLSPPHEGEGKRFTGPRIVGGLSRAARLPLVGRGWGWGDAKRHGHQPGLTRAQPQARPEA